MESTLHLNEFFVEGNSPEDSHVLLNITEPSTPGEKNKGYFFAICEINNAAAKYIAKLQNIVDEIENSYYEIPDQEDKTALEVVLDKINQESFAVVQPDISLHCIVGAIRKNDLIFSFYGAPQMVLFYKNKENLYKKMDLVAENKAVEPEGRQLFSQIIQGKIGPSDFFFTGTPHIVEYFNHDRLQKIITTRPPRQSAEHLQRVLSELKNNLSFGGIIIHLQQGLEGAALPKISPIKKGSARSLKNLFSTEKNTASILSSSILPKLQDRMKGVLRQEKEPAETMAPDPIGGFANAEINSLHLRARALKAKKIAGITSQAVIKKIIMLGWAGIKYGFRGLVLLLLLLGTILTTLGRNFLLLFFVITNYQNRRHNILLEWSRWSKNLKENIKNLPTITKILLTLSIILALSFIFGVTYIKAAQRKTARAQAYAAAIQNIKAKTSAAESSLVYSDTAIALTALKEAEQILNNLACATAAEKANCQSLSEKLTALLMKARQITMAQPQLLADWNSLAPTERWDNIFFLNNKIYGFSANTSTLLSYDPLTKNSALLLPGVLVKGFTAVSVPKENDYAVLLHEDNSISQFKPEGNSWKKIDAGYPFANAKISSMTVYNRKLYSLDTQNKQIYKHDTIKTGFAPGKEWTKTKVDGLSSGVDLAIDGDVFALGKDGAIAKFVKGENQPFAAEGVDPPLVSADKIWTYNDLNYIYILDSAGKRIIVLDKNGGLKTQIMANEFFRPTGMVVDEMARTAFVLDDNKLYQIKL